MKTFYDENSNDGQGVGVFNIAQWILLIFSMSVIQQAAAVRTLISDCI